MIPEWSAAVDTLAFGTPSLETPMLETLLLPNLFYGSLLLLETCSWSPATSVDETSQGPTIYLDIETGSI